MKSITGHDHSEKVSMSSHHVLNEDDTGKLCFLSLPVELRLKIYKYSILNFRRPSPTEVHEELLSIHWKDRPSPLLGLNRQIRAEISDLLQRSPFTMRITWQDKEFDALALSSFIVQQRRKSYDDIPHLVVEVWPPHPDRPSDMYYIYDHLRQLRNDLRALPQVPKLDLVFLENSVATWSSHGKLLKWLAMYDSYNDEELEYTDIGYIFDMFERLVNVVTARIYLPDSLLVDAKYSELRTHARNTEDLMMGIFKGESDTESEELEKIEILPEDCLEGAELYLQRATAKIARAKLDAITDYGANKMTDWEYDEFVHIWSYFDTLEWWDEGGVFDHYMYYADMDDVYWR